MFKRPSTETEEQAKLKAWVENLEPAEGQDAEYRLAFEYSTRHNRILADSITSLDEKASRLFDIAVILLGGLITLYTTTDPLRSWPTVVAFVAFIIVIGLMVWVRMPTAMLPGIDAQLIIERAAKAKESFLLAKLAASLHRSTVSMRAVMNWKANVVTLGAFLVCVGLVFVVVALLMHWASITDEEASEAPEREAVQPAEEEETSGPAARLESAFEVEYPSSLEAVYRPTDLRRSWSVLLTRRPCRASSHGCDAARLSTAATRAPASLPAPRAAECFPHSPCRPFSLLAAC